MQPDEKKLLTIVTEAVIESSLTGDLKRLGAGGYTIVDARGSGSRGIRDAGWQSSGNIRVEVVCDTAVARRIVDHLREHYYRDYAMILYVSEVSVLRPEKF